ncbi:DUF1659 domain-containing protein [Lysinibacillus fusiformis]|nr:DUF1659 domain-containing protein [Lysinibacillus fusiformis]
MATYNYDNATLKLSFETGIDELGKAIVSAKTYRNVRNNVQPDEVFTVVQALASLSSYELLFVEKILTETVDM